MRLSWSDMGWFAALCFTFAIVIAGCASSTDAKSGSDHQKAPEVNFTDTGGNTTTFNDYKNKSVVLVNFWGLRCQNCIEEMPFLERLYNKYGGKGLVVLGVNTDGVDGASLVKHMKRLPVKVSYPIIVDPDFYLVDKFKMMAAPLTIVVAKDSTVRFRHEGYEPEIESTYVELIEKLLAE